jgi:hypothetical protein
LFVHLRALDELTREHDFEVLAVTVQQCSMYVKTVQIDRRLQCTSVVFVVPVGQFLDQETNVGEGVLEGIEF